MIPIFHFLQSLLDLLKSCQHAVELSPSPRRYSGYVGRNDWVIDPDGSGDIKPFKANCHMNWQTKDGVTEVKFLDIGNHYDFSIPKY